MRKMRRRTRADTKGTSISRLFSMCKWHQVIYFMIREGKISQKKKKTKGKEKGMNVVKKKARHKRIKEVRRK